jgi:uncharacterized protein GlcG (DUF336 family)
VRNSASAALLLACALVGCGGGSGGGDSTTPPSITPAPDRLYVPDVERIVSQAVAEAQARNARGHIAVVDRVGNVLALYTMAGAPDAISIGSGPPARGGLETREALVPATLAAITKAITGAYLSSRGNAFSTRTASQIVQEHFNPDEAQQPSGPLYGVQFSQLTCSDVMRNSGQGRVGPKRSPLGLAGDPGGLPLYKNGTLVGGVGVEIDGRYGIDREFGDVDDNVEEHVAVAGAFGFAAPADIRGERITADGRTFRYVDSDSLVSDPSRAPARPPGPYAVQAGYFDGTVQDGTAYGTAASGIRAADGALGAQGAWIVVDAAGSDRFPARAAPDSQLARADVEAILAEALAIAQRARGQIRRPLGSIAEVSISVVATNGDILGLVRTPDAPIFGIDVAVQKARSAMWFSHPDFAMELATAPPAVYLDGTSSALGTYVTRLREFAGAASVGGSIAWSARAIGNVHRPFFPDGIAETGPGPLSTPYATWSPFNVGLQLDLVNNQLVRGALGDLGEGCAGRAAPASAASDAGPGIAKVRNGIQVFPGGVPIYRNGALAGAVGISGDGVDQDDMIAFLGLANAGTRLANGVGNAPAAMRADQLTPLGTRLRYVQCPQSPFNGSDEQNVCAGK